MSLGYRKPLRGVGGWVAKIVVEGGRAEERIGDADDDEAGSGALAYRAAVAAALEWSRRQYAALQGGKRRALKVLDQRWDRRSMTTRKLASFGLAGRVWSQKAG